MVNDRFDSRATVTQKVAVFYCQSSKMDDIFGLSYLFYNFLANVKNYIVLCITQTKIIINMAKVKSKTAINNSVVWGVRSQMAFLKSLKKIAEKEKRSVNNLVLMACSEKYGIKY